MKRQWFTANKILEEHISLPVRQIYLWLVSSDKKTIIVEKYNGDFQQPGGKPEKGETFRNTIHREIYEEVGIEIERFNTKPHMVGYYLMENDPNHKTTYLQLRFSMTITYHSNEIVLGNNEKKDDDNKIKSAYWIALDEVPKYLTWITEREEYSLVKG